MIKCVVEMYGFALEESGLSEIEVDLNEGARLGDLVAELRRKIPALEGRVIRPGENRLVDRCAFNIEGRFYFDNTDLKLNDGCRVRLLTLATGG